jgi:hypothetical protein
MMRPTIYEEFDCLREKKLHRRRCEPSTVGTSFSCILKTHFKKISASQNKVLMVKFVINCMLNIQTQHKIIFIVKPGCDNSIFLAVPGWYSDNFCRVPDLVQT